MTDMFETVADEATGKSYVVVKIPDYFDDRLKKQCSRFNEIQRETACGCEQKSEEWLRQRGMAWGSSEIASVLGHNKYKKPQYAIMEKSYLITRFRGNSATQHGEKYEDATVAILNAERGITIHNTTFIRMPSINARAAAAVGAEAGWNHIGDSSDGQYIEIVGNDKGGNLLYKPCVVEIKTLMRGRPIRGFIPEYYKDQIQNHLMVTGFDTCLYAEAAYSEPSIVAFKDMMKGGRLKHLRAGIIGVISTAADDAKVYDKYLYPASVYRADDPDWIIRARQEIFDAAAAKGVPQSAVTFSPWICDGFYVEIVERDVNWLVNCLPSLVTAWKSVLQFRSLLTDTVVKRLREKCGMTMEDILKNKEAIARCFKFQDPVDSLSTPVMEEIENAVNEVREIASSHFGVKSSPVCIVTTSDDPSDLGRISYSALFDD